MTPIRQFAIPFVFVLSATSMLMAQDQMVEMIVGFLNEPDKEMRGIAFESIRNDVKGEAATRTFAEKLSNIRPEAQAGLISALADRGDKTAKPAILKQLTSPDEAVRTAAIRAISKLGDAKDLPLLVQHLSKPGAEADAATASLIQIQGDGITKSLADQLDSGEADTKVRLIEILSSRRAMDTIPRILQAATGKEGKVRVAAMKALGAIAGPDEIPGMIQGVLKAESGSERANGERNIVLVCNRIEDPAKRAAPVLAAIDKLSAAEQTTMLTTLGRLGGSASLERIDRALASKNGVVHSAGLTALANWPNASVAPRLIELAYKDPHVRHQRTALRALIRVTPMNDGRPNEEKLKLLRQAMDMSVRVDDRRYALQRAGAIRIVESLRWLLKYIDDPRYAEQVCTSIVELAHIRDLRDDNKPEFHAALDRVLSTSKVAETLDRANRYKKGQTWVRGD